MKRSQVLKTALLLLLALPPAVGIYQAGKPLPEGLGMRGEARTVPSSHAVFLRDLTFRDREGALVHDQQIFDAAFALIDGAERYILADMFLFNAYSRDPSGALRGLAGELTERLVEKKKSRPSIHIDFITDPINTVYGGSPSAELEALAAAGINVVVTDLRRLRDSNPAYSSLWRTFIQWFGNSGDGGVLPHPFDGSAAGVTLRSYLEMLNFKANHRKVLVADDGGTVTVLVASANPHDGSSAHSNVALLVRGGVGPDAYEAERAVAALSRKSLGPLPDPQPLPPPGGREEAVEVAVLTEHRVKEAVLDAIASCSAGDELWAAMFYLSDREVVEALLEAAAGGAKVRLILDPNRDAFGFKKNGIPNRQAAGELVERSSGSVEVRWFQTHGEQFHSKLLFADRPGRPSSLILGSANLTRRNLDSFNLEMDLFVAGKGDRPPMTQVRSYLERLWENEDGLFTVGYDVFADDSLLRKALYRLQEFSGLCSY